MENLKEKIPPQNLEAEQATLGALLLDWNAFSNIVSLLDSNKFYSYQNKLIYEAMISLFRQNIHGDTLAVINELTKTGKLEEALELPFLYPPISNLFPDFLFIPTGHK